MSHATIQVAVVQAVAVLDDVQRNLATLARGIVQAAAQGAEVVVTPELFATGYNPSTAWHHDGGRIRDELARLAAEHGVGLVASTVDTEADVHRISASFFCPEEGELVRVHKHHLYGDAEREHLRPGAVFGDPVQWRGLRWGLGVCYDIEFPEFARHHALQGADALLIPTAVPVLEEAGLDPSDTSEPDDAHHYSATLTSTLQVPARALENGMYVAYANHAGEGFTGLSCIATPAGRHAVLLGPSEEAVAVTAVHGSAVTRARALNTYLTDLQR